MRQRITEVWQNIVRKIDGLVMACVSGIVAAITFYFIPESGDPFWLSIVIAFSATSLQFFMRSILISSEIKGIGIDISVITFSLYLSVICSTKIPDDVSSKCLALCAMSAFLVFLLYLFWSDPEPTPVESTLTNVGGFQAARRISPRDGVAFLLASPFLCAVLYHLR